MCERPVRIAILDDGVYPAACPVAGSFLIDDDLSVVMVLCVPILWDVIQN